MMNPQTSDIQKARGTPNPFVFLGFSLFMLYAFGYETLYQRLTTQLEGVVVSSHDVHSPNNPRYVTKYVVRRPDGREATFVAGSSDASLPQSMPVGTTIRKRKWRVDYERDGQNVSDFPTALYVLTLGAAVAGLVWSIRLWRRQRMAAK
jgi:hypothetical protein